MAAFHRILVAVDGSEPSDAAVAMALKVAAGDAPADVTFCYVVDTASDYREATTAQAVEIAPQLIAEDKAAGVAVVEAATATARAAGLEARGDVLEGSPADTIVQRAREGGFDLVVCGTHGRRGVGRMFFGSTAEAILRRSTVPVLVAK